MADIDALSIRIEADAKNATRNVNKLANALTKLSEALNAIDPSRLNSAAMAASTMSDAVAGMRSSGKTINSVATAMAKIGEQGANIAQASSATKNMTDAVGGAAKSSEGAANAIKKAAEGTDELGSSSTRANQVVKALSAGFKGFSNTLKSIGTWFKKTASSALKAATHIKLFGKSAKSSSKSASNLVKEITRIGKMLKLMITRMVLRQIISGVGDGFKNLAQYSKQFDATLSLLWNDFRQLGNSIAAAASPLLNVFAPAIHAIIQLVIQAVNAINQLLSALTGLTSFVRAKKLTDSYAGSLKKAGGAAKELKKTVLGFDELNQLQDNNSGGGGGASPLDMFEDAPISKKWKEWADKIKKMWETGDFTELGRAIGEWLLNALNKIPWSKIYRVAAKLGKSLATLINGFVEVPDLGYTMGKSLAKAINTAFYFLDDFVRNLHWKSIGQFIGEALNGFFENIKWNKIYDTVYNGVRGIASAIQEAINTFNWDNISTTIINGLDVVSMGIKEFFEGIDWLDLGQKMGDQLAKTIKGTPWKQVGEAIGSAIQAAIDWVSGFLEKLEVQDVVDALSDMLAGFFEKVKPEQAGENLGKILQFLIDTIKGFWRENHDEVIQAVKDFFSGLFNSVDKDDLKNIVLGIVGFALLNGVKDLAISAATIAFSEKIKAMVTGAAAEKGVEAAATGAGTSVGLSLLGGLAAAFTGAAVAEIIIEALDLKDKWADVGATLAELWRGSPLDEKEQAKLDGVKQKYEGVKGSLTALKEAGKEVLRLFGVDIPQSTYTVTDELGNATANIDEYGNTIIDFSNDVNEALNFEPLVQGAKKLDDGIGTAFVNVKKNSDEFTRTIDRDTKTAFDSVSLNSKVVTQKMPMEMANAGVSMSGTAHSLSLKLDSETKTGFSNAATNSKTFTQEMPKNVSTAQQEMSKSVETLNGDFSTNMGTIQKTVADSTDDINRSLDTVKSGMSEDEWTFSGVWEGLTKTFEKAKEGIKGVWNSIADKLNGTHQVFGSSITIDLPRFANGGFIEDGLFTMNRGEIAGKFNNGKSVVANNEQITEGIARAVFNAMTTAQSSGGGQYINNTIMVDGMVLARAVTKGQSDMNRRYSPTMA